MQNVETLGEGQWLAPHDGHALWWAAGGEPHGLPVVLIHGGPGGASREETVRWWRGQPVRWIAFDQRGCGRSRPLGRLRHNNLAAIVADMERLRSHLGVERWGVAGGSWGARVALAYAAQHPQRTAGLFLRSPFLGSEAETRRYVEAWPCWLGPEGREWLGPRLADGLLAVYQGATSAPLLRDTGFVRGLRGGRMASAWSSFDDAQSQPGGVDARGARFKPPTIEGGTTAPATPSLLAAWRVHLHLARQAWGGPGHADAEEAACRLDGPVHVVWGAADATCDPSQARWLVERFESATAHEVPEAGHRMSDPKLAPALAQAAVAWAQSLYAAADRAGAWPSPAA